MKKRLYIMYYIFNKVYSRKKKQYLPYYRWPLFRNIKIYKNDYTCLTNSKSFAALFQVFAQFQSSLKTCLNSLRAFITLIEDITIINRIYFT